MKYTTVDRILAKLSREIPDRPLSDSDIVEMIGEAMGFLSVAPVLEEVVTFLDVKDFKCALPEDLVHIIQICRKRTDVKVEEITELIKKEEVPIPCEPFCNTIAYTYSTWMCSKVRTSCFEPVRLGDSSHLQSNLVCKEYDQCIYANARDEYSVLGKLNPELIFSFRDGTIALSYLKMATDPDNGYPLIPDQEDFIAAVSYYCKWKIAEAMMWSGRDGGQQLAAISKSEWLRYANQAKQYAKMPKTLDELINNHKRAYKLDLRMDRYSRGFMNRARRYGD